MPERVGIGMSIELHEQSPFNQADAYLKVLSEPPVAVVTTTLTSLTSIARAPKANNPHVTVNQLDQRILGGFSLREKAGDRDSRDCSPKMS